VLSVFSKVPVISYLMSIQAKDIVVIQGRHLYIRRPPNLQEMFPEFDLPEFEEISTGNYRGYRATWAVIHERLYLIGIEGKVDGRILWDEKIFKGAKFPVRVVAWDGEMYETSVSESFDFAAGEKDKFYEISTLVFKSGKLVSLEFDKKELIEKSQFDAPNL